jgi:D-sedoheptulose 7-phosphate isomerase
MSSHPKAAEQLRALQKTLANLEPQLPALEKIAHIVVHALARGHTIFSCGNGGSAADALHLAEELVGRYRKNRRALPAICLNADPTALTCIANDFGFVRIFSRQLEGLAQKNDVLVCFSTSGNSPNVLEALKTARKLGVISVAFLGKGGGKAAKLAAHKVIAPSDDTARAQEVHTFCLHAILEAVDRHFR